MAIKLKRDLPKYIRDKAKSKYNKGTECQICGTTDELDFHHHYTLSLLIHRWVKLNRRKPEDVLEWREQFIEEHYKELYEYVTTLCHSHHLRLHEVYGKNPNLGTAKKQMRWVQIQRDKK